MLTAQAQAARDLTDYLGILARTGDRIAAHVLAHGRPFQRRPTATTDLAYGPGKECFANAHAAAQRPGWHYCEGYAVNAAIPVHHAWVCDPDGRAVDVTWRESGNACAVCHNRPIPGCPVCHGTGRTPWQHNLTDAAYYGIEHDHAAHARALIAAGTYDVLGTIALDEC